MILRVNKNLKGEIVLPTFNHSLKANALIKVTEEQLSNPDIQMAISKGYLILGKKTEKTESGKKVKLINCSSKTITIGTVVLTPKDVFYVDANDMEDPKVQIALSKNIIKRVELKEKAKKVIVEKKNNVKKEVTLPEKILKEHETTPQSYNLRSKKTMTNKEAHKNMFGKEPEIIETKFIDEDKDKIEEEMENKEIKLKNRGKRRKSISSKKTKKTNKKKSKKRAAIEPVGTRRMPTNSDDDLTMSLNSNGQPLNETQGLDNGISFVDNEQKIERMKKANKLPNNSEVK